MEPGTGTFLSMDPSEGGVFDPPSLHKYLYAHANPVTYSDPTGYFSLSELVTAMKVQSILIGVNLFPMVAAYGWAIEAMNDTAIEAILRMTPAALAFDAQDLFWDVVNWNGDSDALLEDLEQTAWDVVPFLKTTFKGIAEGADALLKKAARILSKIPFYDLKKLSQNVQNAFHRYDAHGWKGTPPGQPNGMRAGKHFVNRKNQLPQADKSGNPITYREFDVNPKNPVTGRDAERFVVGSDGSVYYTDSHYGDAKSLAGLPVFVRIK
jgi:hypothetical protein